MPGNEAVTPGHTWFYVSDGARKGPVSTSDLKALLSSSVVTPDTLVYCLELGGDWLPLSRHDISDETSSAHLAPPAPQAVPETDGIVNGDMPHSVAVKGSKSTPRKFPSRPTNIFVLPLSLLPLIAIGIEYLTTMRHDEFYNNVHDPYWLGFSIVSYISVIIMIFLGYIDSVIVEQSRSVRNHVNLFVWPIVPLIYLLQRARAVRGSVVYLAIFIASGVVFVFLKESKAVEGYLEPLVKGM